MPRTPYRPPRRSRSSTSAPTRSAAPGGEVYFRHFGGRIDDPAPLADYKSNRRSDHGTEDLAYPATGGRNFREPALRVTHADGDMNTELRYVSHASKQLSDKNVTETVVKMTDCCQALDVKRRSTTRC